MCCQGGIAGLESLLQLVDVSSGVIRGAPIAIEDGPRFTHRALLVDTSRHFLPIGLLERVIDGMAVSCFTNYGFIIYT